MLNKKRNEAVFCLGCVVVFSSLAIGLRPLVARADPVAASVTVAVGVVDYTGRMFTPNVITILKGDTLLFRNSSDKILDLASDPHPNRNNFPFLNVGIIEKKGGSAAVIFLKTGEYFFHNHAFPDHRGKVIVLDAFAPKEPVKKPFPKKLIPLFLVELDVFLTYTRLVKSKKTVPPLIPTNR